MVCDFGVNCLVVKGTIILFYCSFYVYVSDSHFYLYDFLYSYCMSINGRSLRTKNFTANACFSVIVMHLTIKGLKLESNPTVSLKATV